MNDQEDVYGFTITDLQGEVHSLEKYRGKILLIVNTCSKGDAYKKVRKLAMLRKQFNGQPFEILAFPCNQFAFKERKTEEEIYDFYLVRERCKFPISSKVKVNGSRAHPLFEWLKKKTSNGKAKRIKDNFTRFLVEADGKTVHRYSTKEGWYPMSVDIMRLINEHPDRKTMQSFEPITQIVSATEVNGKASMLIPATLGLPIVH